MQVLYMNKGEGDTSYAKNSLIQKKIMSFGNSMVETAIFNIMLELQPECIWIADLGCSSGPNSFTLVSQIIHKVVSVSHELGRVVPELKVSLNDLPDNDFNKMFSMLPEFYKNVKDDYGIEGCYVAGVPGSFYGRLFPAQSLHLVHSSSSLHWLSQVPTCLGPEAETHLNKEKLYISKSSPTCVVDAYQSQFQDDFSLFLRSRAKEMVFKGRMVMSFLGRVSPHPFADEACYQWELLARALMSMALDGFVEKEKIDSFNAPFYAPSMEEVQHEVENEGSFVVERFEHFGMEWDGGYHSPDLKESSISRIAKTMRAIVEPMFMSHFHFEPEIMDDLFRRYAKIIDDCLSKKRLKKTVLVISVMKMC